MNLDPTCFLEPVHQDVSDVCVQVEILVLLLRVLHKRRNVLEHQDVLGFGFLNKDRCEAAISKKQI